MKKLKRIGKGLVLSGVVISLIGGIVYTVLSYSVSVELERELEEIKHSGKPITLEELTPAPVPDEENAALIYKKAFAMIVKGTKEEEKLHNLKWSEKEIPAVRRLLEKNEDTLNLLREAAQLEKCHFPLDYTKGFEMLLPHLRYFRTCARLLAADALIKSMDGKTDEALSSCQVGLGMGKALQDSPLAISLLVRNATDSIILTALEEIFSKSGGASKGMCYAVLSELDISEEGCLSFARTFEVERCLGISTFRRMQNDPSYLEKVSGASEEEFKKAGLKGINEYLARYGEEDFLAYLRLMKKNISLWQVPYYESRESWQELLSGENAIPPQAILTNMLMPALFRIAVVNAHHDALVRANYLALALKIYKTGRGAYPESLQDLVPGIIGKLPSDPFTGRDYIYKREGEGFAVYSVADNLKDDGGNWGKPNRYTGDFDIVCRFER